MILHAIEMTSVGPFIETVRVGPFAPGLNILAAPNESGKTTALRAAARAFFDRHTTKSQDLKLLRPVGTDLAPRVCVEFEAKGDRYRIEKTFLQAPRSILYRWQDGRWSPLAEADAADGRVRDLLGSTLPGNGATRPEHWGMLGFLWARQGEPSNWPGFGSGGVGEVIRARLAQVEIDPLVERLRASLSSEASESFTSKGQRRRGGPLDRAENELERIEAALAELAKARETMQAAREIHERASAEVVQLESEHAERAAAAESLRQQAEAAEKGKAELQRRKSELATAQTALDAVAADAGRWVSLQSDLEKVAAVLSDAEGSVRETETKLEDIRKAIAVETAKRPGLGTRLAELRSSQQRVLALLRLRRLAADTGELARLVASAEASDAKLGELRKRRAEIPSVTPRMLAQIEGDFGKVRTLSAQVEALGLMVELTPEKSGNLEVNFGSKLEVRELGAGEKVTLRSAQSMELRLEGWGRLRVRSGATEARELAEELEDTARRLKCVLEEVGVDSPEAAREAISVRRQLDVEIKAAAAMQRQQLGEYESLDRIREALAASRQRERLLGDSLAPETEELEQSSASLESTEARCEEAIPVAEAAMRDLDRLIESLREQESNALAERDRRKTEMVDQRILRRTLEAQIADLKERYPQGTEGAKANAQTEFVRAEARLEAVKSELPPDFEKLPDRNRRASAALQQLANDIQARRAERDNASGALATLGGQGIFSRETELMERRTEVMVRRNAARDRGWSARIASDLIEYRRQAATRSVLAPLEARLSAAFAELTGRATRRVFLNENLQIAGIGRTSEALYPFDSLSQGAREQLLLCLRLAVASELALDEPQVLILDDVLVNTDGVRQERILDRLGAMAGNLQILILTCHPDRFRGAGAVVEMGRPQPPEVIVGEREVG